jgi:hypothetical protein
MVSRGLRRARARGIPPPLPPRGGV